LAVWHEPACLRTLSVLFVPLRASLSSDRSAQRGSVFVRQDEDPNRERTLFAISVVRFLRGKSTDLAPIGERSPVLFPFRSSWRGPTGSGHVIAFTLLVADDVGLARLR
jgi:hypothetical protein